MDTPTQSPHRTTKVANRPGDFLLIRKGRNTSRVVPRDHPEGPSLVVRTALLFETEALPRGESSSPDPITSLLPEMGLTAHDMRARYDYIFDLLLNRTPQDVIIQLTAQRFSLSLATAQNNVRSARQSLEDRNREESSYLRSLTAAQLERIINSPTADYPTVLKAIAQLRQLLSLDLPPAPLQHHLHLSPASDLPPPPDPRSRFQSHPALLDQLAALESALIQEPSPANSCPPNPP